MSDLVRNSKDRFSHVVAQNDYDAYAHERLKPAISLFLMDLVMIFLLDCSLSIDFHFDYIELLIQSLAYASLTYLQAGLSCHRSTGHFVCCVFYELI